MQVSIRSTCVHLLRAFSLVLLLALPLLSLPQAFPIYAQDGGDIYLPAVLNEGNSTATPTPQPTGEAETIAAYLDRLDPWDPGPTPSSEKPQQAGSVKDEPEVALGVEKIDEDGKTHTEEITYRCRTTPYSLEKNPQELVMYGSVNSEILWPGALIQGDSHRNGIGGLLGFVLDGSERNPIDVTIPVINVPSNLAAGNTKRVTNPTKASVTDAIGTMIGDATANELDTASSIAFTMETYHSEEKFALDASLSGRYLNFSGSATGEYDQDASETTIAVHFYQTMYEVSANQPQTPESLFSTNFTLEDLRRQEELGRIGPDNQPIYVSKAVYGRMMMFTFTSTASETAIRATLQAAYDGIEADIEAKFSAEQETILQEAEIKITSVGGNADATLAVIRSGDWSQYFTANAPLSTAAPMAYIFRNLQDGSIASVYETTKYDLRTCTEVDEKASFEWLPEQELGLPIDVPATAHAGDFNGDELTDLAWTHLGGNQNQAVIALANGDGTFAMQEPSPYPDVDHTWGTFKAYVGDINGDKRSDLVWNSTNIDSPSGKLNRTYIGLSNGDGTFTLLDAQTAPGTVWQNYQLLLDDMNGDGRTDLIWNILTTAQNRTYVAFAAADGTLEFAPFQDHARKDWSTFKFRTGDVNGDGSADIIWNSVEQIRVVGVQPRNYNQTYIGLSLDDGSFTFLAPQEPANLGWGGYQFHVGDGNGDGRTDLIWNSLTKEINRAYFGLSNLDGTLDYQPFRDHKNKGWAAYQASVGDANGDGRADLIWNGLFDANNRTYVGLGSSDGTLNLTSRAYQDHPATAEWTQFQLLLGDVNGDGKSDTIWTHPSADNPVHVGFGR